MRYIKLFEEYTQSHIDIGELKKIRSFLETKWSNNNSTNECIRTAYFLKNVIGGSIKGGWCSSLDNQKSWEKGGFKDDKGIWNLHYWIVKDGYIIDLTANQFGADEIIVTQKNDKRYYHNATEGFNKGDMENDFMFTHEFVDPWIEEYINNQN